MNRVLTNVIKDLGPFSVILESSNFHKVESTNTSSAGMTSRKIKKTYFDLSAFNENLNDSNL